MSYKRSKRITQTIIAQQRRREEVAFLYLFEEYTAEEISEYSVYSLRTIKGDIAYIETHREEFLR